MAWQPTKACPSWEWASATTTTTTTTTTDSSDGTAATTAMVVLQSTLDADLKKQDADPWAVDDLMPQNGRHSENHQAFCHGGGSSSALGINLSSLVPPPGCPASSGSSSSCTGLFSFLDYSRQSPLLFNGGSASKGSSYEVADCRLGTAAIDTCKHGMVDCKLCVADGKQYSEMKTDNSGFLELSSSSSLAQWKPIPEKRASTSQGQLFLPCGTHQDTSGTQSTEEQYSSTATGSAGSGDSLTGLHLGKRNYNGDDASGMASAGTLKPPILNKPTTPPSKKQRASSANLQTPRCQVYGCNIELTTAKAYHRRHKVCDAHSKAEKVVVANLEQRFCQQCSRFHVLAEFDEVKRSCRKRLAGHNERRRKPHPDTLSLNARFSSIFQEWPFFHGSRLMGLPSSLLRDPMDSRSLSFKGPWQKWDDPKGHSWDLMQSSSGIEKELFLTGFSVPPSHITQKSSPLVLLQSPTGMMLRPPTNDLPSERCLQYVARSFSDLGNGLTLSSSSERGAGTLSGLEVMPPPPPLPLAAQAVARVADSGCALSLLSAGSHAPDAVSLDLSTGTTGLLVDSLMHENNVSIQHDLALNHSNNYSITADNLMTVAFNSHKDSSVSNGVGDEQYVSSLVHHGYSGNGATGCFQSLPLFSLTRQHGHTSKAHHQAPRPTVELMQIMPLSHYAHQPHEQSVSFQLGGNPFGDLHYSDESHSFIDLQQKI